MTRIEVRLVELQHPSRQEARRVLRALLASRIGCEPDRLEIVRGPTGKPRLCPGTLEFSFSQRDRWCAAAFSPDCAVGVDVEPIRLIPGMAEVVERFFPPNARAEFAAARRDQRLAVFFRWWTRIEAAVKAKGLGLDDAPSCLDGVAYRSCEASPELALAAAACSQGPLEITLLKSTQTTAAVPSSRDFKGPAQTGFRGTDVEALRRRTPGCLHPRKDATPT